MVYYYRNVQAAILPAGVHGIFHFIHLITFKKEELHMAFDGITIANIAQELNQTIVGGKINKIAQPENDELMIT